MNPFEPNAIGRECLNAGRAEQMGPKGARCVVMFPCSYPTAQTLRRSAPFAYALLSQVDASPVSHLVLLVVW